MPFVWVSEVVGTTLFLWQQRGHHHPIRATPGPSRGAALVVYFHPQVPIVRFGRRRCSGRRRANGRLAGRDRHTGPCSAAALPAGVATSMRRWMQDSKTSSSLRTGPAAASAAARLG